MALKKFYPCFFQKKTRKNLFEVLWDLLGLKELLFKHSLYFVFAFQAHFPSFTKNFENSLYITLNPILLFFFSCISSYDVSNTHHSQRKNLFKVLWDLLGLKEPLFKHSLHFVQWDIFFPGPFSFLSQEFWKLPQQNSESYSSSSFLSLPLLYFFIRGS